MGHPTRLTASIIVLFFLGCAGQPSPGEYTPSLPKYREFQASPRALSDAAVRAVLSSGYGLELDTRRTTPDSLITHQRPLPIRGLKALAAPGEPGLRGKTLNADLQVLLSIRPSYTCPECSRVTIQPIFRVYISRWRDQRQWIQWHSNGTLEDELLSYIEAELQPTKRE